MEEVGEDTSTNHSIQKKTENSFFLKQIIKQIILVKSINKTNKIFRIWALTL